jgi:hypothetical protein
MDKRVLWSGRPSTGFNLARAERWYFGLSACVCAAMACLTVSFIVMRDVGAGFTAVATLFMAYSLFNRLIREPRLRASLTYSILDDAFLIERDDGDKSVLSFADVVSIALESDDMKVGTILIFTPWTHKKQRHWRDSLAVNPWLHLRWVVNPGEVYRIVEGALAVYRARVGHDKT